MINNLIEKLKFKLDWKIFKSLIIFFCISLVIVIIDQWSKVAMESWLKTLPKQTFPIIDNIFDFSLVYNYGAAGGQFEGQRVFLSLFSLISAIAIVYFLLRNIHPFFNLSLSLLLGGTIGNMIDRIRTGVVIDFIHTYFYQFDFPVYNIADVMIVSGVIGLMIYFLLIEGRKKANGNEVKK